jgi:hypothetical protein
MAVAVKTRRGTSPVDIVAFGYPWIRNGLTDVASDYSCDVVTQTIVDVSMKQQKNSYLKVEVGPND